MLQIYFETVSCDSAARFHRALHPTMENQSLNWRAAQCRTSGKGLQLFPGFRPRIDTTGGSERRPRPALELCARSVAPDRASRRQGTGDPARSERARGRVATRSCGHALSRLLRAQRNRERSVGSARWAQRGEFGGAPAPPAVRPSIIACSSSASFERPSASSSEIKRRA